MQAPAGKPLIPGSLAAWHEAVRAPDKGAQGHEALLVHALERSQQPRAAHTFTKLYAGAALASARHADALQLAGITLGPLMGLPVSVKDLFDIAGETTLAGSLVQQDAPAATADAPAVARLRAAGAALIGKTAMSEFAFSGVGLNPHYGTPVNPCDDGVARIPGGSSSGAAVSVALGLAVAGLGTDTGGSIRIPAALCGLVGFKPTQARVPTAGAFPLAPSMDTVGAITRSVEDALVLDAILAGAPLAVVLRPLAGRRLGLPHTLVLDGLEPAVAQAFERALTLLSKAGAVLHELPLTEFSEIAQINAPGGFSPVEAWATHRDRLATKRAQFDPRVALRIEMGAGVSAADYLLMQRRRRDWIARCTRACQSVDAIICPTVPMIAPPLEPLRQNDEAFFKANALLLRNPAVVNFWDGCAFSLPAHGPGELPVGLMLSAPGGSDAELASVALGVQAVLALSLRA